jgi:hypothetical protein
MAASSSSTGNPRDAALLRHGLTVAGSIEGETLCNGKWFFIVTPGFKEQDTVPAHCRFHLSNQNRKKKNKLRNWIKSETLHNSVFGNIQPQDLPLQSLKINYIKLWNLESTLSSKTPRWRHQARPARPGSV